ncbi:unnamed protein product [Prorocentrum cordatum]|uniref:Uncharacterized protein n=1 Tax=Prorocentrum cordatum TaxID=2364126 RepID=A0ABN9WK00_9DINO|nr:unnamed protein product [Polarella glacialis]
MPTTFSGTFSTSAIATTFRAKLACAENCGEIPIKCCNKKATGNRAAHHGFSEHALGCIGAALSCRQTTSPVSLCSDGMSTRRLVNKCDAYKPPPNQHAMQKYEQPYSANAVWIIILCTKCA